MRYRWTDWVTFWSLTKKDEISVDWLRVLSHYTPISRYYIQISRHFLPISRFYNQYPDICMLCECTLSDWLTFLSSTQKNKRYWWTACLTEWLFRARPRKMRYQWTEWLPAWLRGFLELGQKRWDIGGLSDCLPDWVTACLTEWLFRARPKKMRYRCPRSGAERRGQSLGKVAHYYF